MAMAVCCFITAAATADVLTGSMRSGPERSFDPALSVTQSLAAFLIRGFVPGDTGRFRAQIETAPRRLAVEPRPTHTAPTPKSGPRHLATLSVPCFRR
jgi:hypothetical protein